jgi:hypothetical protein
MISTLEIFIWIGIAIIISEVIFIIWTKWYKKNEDEYNIFSQSGDTFLSRKIISLLIGGLFTFIQFAVVWCSNEKEFNLVNIPRYEFLLYEVIIIGFIALFFLINKKINDYILK